MRVCSLSHAAEEGGGPCGVPCSTRQLGADTVNVGKRRREIRALFEFLQFIRQLELPIGIFSVGTRDVDRIRLPEDILELQRQQRRIRTCEVQMERMAKSRSVWFPRRGRMDWLYSLLF